MFWFYLKRMVKSPVFWGCVVAMAIIMTIGCYEDLSVAAANNLSVFYCFSVTISVGISHVLVPAVTVIPFLFFFVDELEKGALYYQLVRTRKTFYYLGQIGAAIVSSMMVTLLATVLFTVICAICGAGWQADDALLHNFRNTFYENMIQNQLWLVYLIYAFVFALYSMSWVLIGMVISLFTKHRYLILIGPFMIFMIANYLIELIGNAEIMWLRPGNTLLKGYERSWAGGGIYYALAYHVILSVMLSLYYLLISKRRFYHEGI